MRRWKEVDQTALSAFAYFDRQSGFSSVSGNLPRSKLESVILCLDEDMTMGELREVLDVPGCGRGEVSYKTLAMEPKEELIPEKEPEKEEEKKEEEKKEEKKDAEKKEGATDDNEV